MRHSSRRSFLKNTTRLSMMLAIPPYLLGCGSSEEKTVSAGTSSNAAQQKMKDFTSELGLQLYTLRNQLAEDPVATLKAVKEAGYAHVEGMDTESLIKLKPILDDLGLGVKSTFYNWTAVTGSQEVLRKLSPEAAPNQSFEEMVETAEKFGLSEMVFGYMLPNERSTLDDYKRRVEQINKAGELIKAAGMQQCYHHHSFEFATLGPDGTRGWDILVDELDSELTKFEIDVFWAAIGGENPEKLIKGLGARTHLLHLKDLKSGVETIHNEQEVPEDAFQEVGDGRLDFDAILKVASEVDVAYCMVEQDQSPDPIESIGQSYRYLTA